MLPRSPVIAVMATLLFSSSPALAQEASTRTIDALLRCRDRTESVDRLACFDREAAALTAQRLAGTLVVLDRQAVIGEKQRRFGRPTKTGDLFGGGAADTATMVRSVGTTLRRAEPNRAAPGRWDLDLANGTRWQTLENVLPAPRPGAAIVIERASLGGFRARLGDARRTVTVKRIR